MSHSIGKTKKIKTIISYISRFFFPNICRDCHKIITDNNHICNDCYNNISFLYRHINVLYKKGNSRASRPIYLPANSSILSSTHDLFHPPVSIYSAVVYKGFGQTIVNQFKYSNNRSLAYVMSDMISEIHKDIFSQYDIIIPIPLHNLRFFQRGFNQAADVSRILSKKHNIEFCPHILKRIVYTKASAGLSKDERFINTHNAFHLLTKYQDFVKDKKILLFDDVYTTGATTKAASLELLKYKPKKLSILTFARTLLD